MKSPLSILAIAAFVAVAGCGEAASSPVITADGSTPAARAGDALRLRIDNAPDGAAVTWNGPPLVKALSEGSDPSASILPQPSDQPTAFWLDNPTHYSDGELAGVLFVLDPGTKANPVIEVSATITTDDSTEELKAQIPIGAMGAGDVTRGAALYAANCATCHGAQGQGGTDYPALNNNPGLPAAEWPAALFASGTRGDIDDMGVSLRADMPRWLIRPDASGQLLTGQNFADIFAWLKTQTTAPISQ